MDDYIGRPPDIGPSTLRLFLLYCEVFSYLIYYGTHTQKSAGSVIVTCPATLGSAKPYLVSTSNTEPTP